jgi:hypothetical protein
MSNMINSFAHPTSQPTYSTNPPVQNGRMPIQIPSGVPQTVTPINSGAMQIGQPPMPNPATPTLGGSIMPPPQNTPMMPTTQPTGTFHALPYNNPAMASPVPTFGQIQQPAGRFGQPQNRQGVYNAMMQRGYGR